MDDELNAEYTKAHTRELNARAELYSAITGMLNTWNMLAKAFIPAVGPLAGDLIKECQSRASR